MSKLDDIIDEIDFIEFPPHVANPYNEAKQAIKALMLELIDACDANEFDPMAGQYTNSMWIDREELRQKVEEL